MAMSIDHIQLAIPAGSETKCRVFWHDVLEMIELEKPAALLARGGAWFRKGTAEVHLGVETDFRPALKAHPAFAVPSIKSLAKRLEDAGFAVRWDTAIAGRARFFTDDPVGNRVEFVEKE
jgi:catechol 2,3-dioxygenase-like lactoylglutathione lyase family enzyme